jgi:hypothetical protein
MGKKWDMPTCYACGTKQRVGKAEWIRASRPRCMACGELLLQARGAIQKDAEHHDAAQLLARAPITGSRGRKKGNVI